jgi:hypothetical protein
MKRIAQVIRPTGLTQSKNRSPALRRGNAGRRAELSSNRMSAGDSLPWQEQNP